MSVPPASKKIALRILLAADKSASCCMPRFSQRDSPPILRSPVLHHPISPMNRRMPTAAVVLSHLAGLLNILSHDAIYQRRFADTGRAEERNGHPTRDVLGNLVKTAPRERADRVHRSA